MAKRQNNDEKPKLKRKQYGAFSSGGRASTASRTS
jgi:hypothetical protein